MSSCVLDASAFLAYLHGEPGADEVAEAVAQTAAISVVNWAGTVSKLAEVGRDPREISADLEEQGLLPGLVELEPPTDEDAIVVGELRPPTREHGISLGDRFCLALAMRLGLPVLTADRQWHELGLPVEVRPIR